MGKGVKILSLFDGMACGMLAMKKAGVEVEEYTAYEIDKYAIQTATHNFPMIKECGDIFKADFKQYKDIDYIVGGSPCVPAGTKIKTDKGYKNIENIEIGDNVLTHKNRYKPVIRLYKRIADHLYHIYFNENEVIDITGNHPVYIYKNGEFKFVRTDELTIEDYVCINIEDSSNLKYNYDKIIEDKLLIKIKGIEKELVEVTVYNIEVEEDQSYTVNNCIVHNCTYWSIAQKNNRETEASGLGWELFSQYVRALNEVKPKYFIYENNKSMSKAIRESITKTFGFEPICINSALVSAQNRQRLYWVGKRNDDGTYSKVDVKQPNDKGILIKDILESGEDLTSKNKGWTLTASYNGAVPWNTIERSQRNMVAEPVGTTKDNKAYCLTSGYSNGSGENIGNYAAHTLKKGCKTMVAEPVNVTANNKAHTIKAQYYKNGMANFVTNGGHSASAVAEPVCMRYERSEKAKQVRKEYEQGKLHHGFHELSELHPRTDGKTNTLSTVLKDNPICEPVRVGALPRPNGELSTSQAMRVYSTEGKSVNLTASGGGMGGKTGLYAIPIEFEEDIPIKAISCADGKSYTVYEVKDGLITIKDKKYEIKLEDGYYIIRKLTVLECKRLQTVPEWYEFPVSDTQAYKMLGNGWTVDVIAHLIEATLR